MRLIFLACMVCLLTGLFVGCEDEGPLTTEWTHNRRHYKEWREEMKQMNEDFDELISDLETHPMEETEDEIPADSQARDGMHVPLIVIVVAAVLAAAAAIILLHRRRLKRKRREETQD